MQAAPAWSHSCQWGRKATVPAASGAWSPPSSGSLLGLAELHPLWRQEIPHPHPSTPIPTCEGFSTSPLPGTATPAGSSNNQTIPSSAQTHWRQGLFLESERFKFIPCLENISPAEDVSVRMTSPPRAALCASLGVLGQPGSSGLQLKACISLTSFLNYRIFLPQI